LNFYFRNEDVVWSIGLKIVLNPSFRREDYVWSIRLKIVLNPSFRREDYVWSIGLKIVIPAQAGIQIIFDQSVHDTPYAATNTASGILKRSLRAVVGVD
jgi:hypothetical protein